MNAKQPGSEIPPTETIASAGWGTVFLIYALCVAAASCISQAVPVIGDIARYFHAPREQAGLVISLPSALGAIGALAVGWIVDRAGDKRTLLVGCALLIAGDIGVTVAPSLTALLIYRAIEGVGYVCVAVGTVTMVARITQGKQRTVALALWSSFVPMSFAIPLILAALVAGAAHWRWAFLGHAIITFVLALAGLTLPRWQRSSGTARTVGLASVLRSAPPFALGTAFAAGAFVQTGIISTLPQLLTSRYGVPFGLASAVGTVGMLSNVAGCLSMGPLLNRGHSVGKLVMLSVGLALAATLILAVAPLPFWGAVVAAIAFFCGAGLVVGFWALLPTVAPSPSARGATSGLVTQLTLWGVLFGPPAAFAALGNPGRQAINVSVAWVLCLLLMLFVARRVGGMSIAKSVATATH
jgi:MFS family permease